MKSKGDFAIAVQILLSCAQKKGGLVSSAELAESVGVHPSRIRTIVSKLAKAAILEAREGRSGGVCLKRPAGKVDLEEVLRVVDPSPFIKIHETPKSAKCLVSCGMEKVMELVHSKVEEAARKSLRTFHLDDLLEFAVE
ncbi:MAG: Rrf2 family transcriptional regulator [Cryobacterium sp.]|nr:Rrf2 family transcriptional regulator [Oligoflexia bacterium]